MSSKTPLLPSHVDHSRSHGLSTPKISFPSASTSTFGAESESTLVDPNNKRRSWISTSPNDRGHREGVPKLSRECLWSEIKCYGSYILPVFLIFGVLVVGACLFAVGWKRDWF
ncbi:hypothetical protein P7C73_g4054, partial [Tremellales sp. Uapishka_1]